MLKIEKTTIGSSSYLLEYQPQKYIALGYMRFIKL
jgi:hypothetical protein